MSSLRTHRFSDWQILIAVVLLLFFSVTIISYLSQFYVRAALEDFKPKKSTPSVYHAPRPTATLEPSPTFIPTPTISLPVHGYEVIILKKKDYHETILADAVGRLLLSQKQLIDPDATKTTILYDSTRQSPYMKDLFTTPHKVFLLVRGKIEAKHFENDILEVTIVQSLSPTMVKYLDIEGSQKYCQVDADCKITTNFCSYDAYNNYRIFYDVWGCEGNYDEEKQCQIKDIKYSGAKCVQNKCVGLNKRVVCEE